MLRSSRLSRVLALVLAVLLLAGPFAGWSAAARCLVTGAIGTVDDCCGRACPTETPDTPAAGNAACDCCVLVVCCGVPAAPALAPTVPPSPAAPAALAPRMPAPRPLPTEPLRCLGSADARAGPADFIRTIALRF